MYRSSEQVLSSRGSLNGLYAYKKVFNVISPKWRLPKEK